ncbi:sensor histidine kinase [Actinoallomurus iriomotensis]|uniref:histidine kinase n=1 Tax=Actinoallomurus iriomotensis TaxID=478107 RepID=A0A9W6VUG4_9ACTN|nr:sensor histidine kinase [Actinoallomurus iriomotensis]GLY79537.1 ATPase [Actinoallomurus iriomotensis]
MILRRALRRPGPRAGDTVLAICLVLGFVAAGETWDPPGWRPFDTLAILLSAVAGLPLALRRRYPRTILLVSCAGYAGYIAAGYVPSITVWASLLAVYTVAATRPPRDLVLGMALTMAVILYGGASLPGPLAVIEALLVPACVCAVGTNARRLSERNVQLADLTARLRVEQEYRARQAVAEERVRIARELHDVVAHHMSVVSVQAGLARYTLASDPQTARGALDTALATSGEALTEMRRLLAVLRMARPDPGEHGYGTAPGLSRLEELAGRVRSAGVPVEVTVTGTPRPLPSGHDQCAFRVIQEALTNVLRHAGQARASVTVAYEAERVVVHVVDDGRGAGERPAPHGMEEIPHGLLGMRERASIYDGQVIAGPRPEGGFEVVLTLPVPPASPDGPVTPAATP